MRLSRIGFEMSHDKYSMYVRYSCDQGYLSAPLDLSGSFHLVTAVPQNVVYALQQLIQVRREYEQDAHRRIHDLRSVSLGDRPLEFISIGVIVIATSLSRVRADILIAA